MRSVMYAASATGRGLGSSLAINIVLRECDCTRCALYPLRPDPECSVSQSFEKYGGDSVRASRNRGVVTRSNNHAGGQDS